MDETKCVVDVVANCMKFFAHESCGQCVPCREGCKRMLDILNGWTRGEGEAFDLEMVERLGMNMRLASRCGLGQFAPVALLSALELFPDEFRAHVIDKRCPTGVCPMDTTVANKEEQLCWQK